MAAAALPMAICTSNSSSSNSIIRARRHHQRGCHRPLWWQSRGQQGGRAARLRPLAFVDPWSPVVDNPQQVATQFFALSIFPYAGFLFTLTRSKPRVPRLALVGFYFLLLFVFATIPAGIYAKVTYGKSLANVDWLHGSAEALLTITNILIVIGMQIGIQDLKNKQVEDKDV